MAEAALELLERVEQVSLCVSILERFLQALDPPDVIRDFRGELQEGLFHPDDAVKILTISQVGRIVENSDAVREVVGNPELLRQIIYCIGGEKISVAKEAIKSLSRIAQTQDGLEALFGRSLLVDLKNVMGTSDIVRYRVYELIVEISSVSADSLNYCANSGLISDLLGELTGEDVLVRTTCIEMVTSLAYTQHGRRYLAQQGIIDKISNIIIGADSDPFSGFYLPGFVKFFGNLAIVDSPQQICERYPVFVEKVFEMAEGHDPTMIGVAVDTLGILGSNMEGKQVLQKTKSRFQDLLNRIGHHARNAPTELRLRCLDAISSLLYLPPDQQTEDLLRMTESWFVSLSSQPLELFRGISTQPFPDLHCGALRVFTAIASQPWAQKLMLESPGFIEYIVDRSVEPDKPSKDAKYELRLCVLKAWDVPIQLYHGCNGVMNWQIRYARQRAAGPKAEQKGEPRGQQRHCYACDLHITVQIDWNLDPEPSSVLQKLECGFGFPSVLGLGHEKYSILVHGTCKLTQKALFFCWHPFCFGGSRASGTK
ncbi:26S proteasome non-ATPase regulatory subunit 5 isoform C [Alligator mississippiensis]|uniref:26S proteasome non-ATPase regulatory subunit 5 n=1 Tax=Alligator mississippiensis TaxID=8496 RepID=A0A151MG01_ALLMI|nr:26S proteasome non-ATPase regulatory subunit 5 isoform C [Alligator mississippiensis]